MRGRVGARYFLFLRWSGVVSIEWDGGGGGRYYVSVAFMSAAIFLCLRRKSSTHMIVHGFKNFLGRNQQRGHFPNGHLKVHLRELE